MTSTPEQQQDSVLAQHDMHQETTPIDSVVVDLNAEYPTMRRFYTLIASCCCAVTAIISLHAAFFVCMVLLIYWSDTTAKRVDYTFLTYSNVLLMACVSICILASCTKQLVDRCRMFQRDLIATAGLPDSTASSDDSSLLPTYIDSEGDSSLAARLEQRSLITRALLHLYSHQHPLHFQSAEDHSRASSALLRLQLATTDRDFSADDYEHLLQLDNENQAQAVDNADLARLPVFKIPANLPKSLYNKEDEEGDEHDSSCALKDNDLEMQETPKRPSKSLTHTTTTTAAPSSSTVQDCSQQLVLSLVTQKCPICLENFAPNDLITTLPNCMHRYHQSCAFNWLRIKNSCPVCKSNVM